MLGGANARVFVQEGVNDIALSSDTFAVDDSEGADVFLETSLDVGINEFGEIAGMEGVKVGGSIDGDFDRIGFV